MTDFCKRPDFPAWVASLKGLAPSDQIIALRLAEQADEDGEVVGVDWERLEGDTGLTQGPLRERLRPGRALIDEGYILAEQRQVDRVWLPTIYRINLMRGG